jgi:hypothetical protein
MTSSTTNPIAGSLGRIAVIVGVLVGCDPQAPTPLDALGTAAPVVHGCMDALFVDRSAPGAERRLTWDPSIPGNPARCLRIQVGQHVEWDGSFSFHPLEAEDGDTPNPIADHADGRVTFHSPGTFGYVCGFHPQMNGAVRVMIDAHAAGRQAGPPR